MSPARKREAYQVLSEAYKLLKVYLVLHIREVKLYRMT